MRGVPVRYRLLAATSLRILTGRIPPAPVRPCLLSPVLVASAVLMLLVALPLPGQGPATEFPLPLFVDGQFLGEIPAIIRGEDTLELVPADLADAVEDLVDPETAAFFRSLDPRIPVAASSLERSGLTIALDLNELVVRVTIPAEQRRTRLISLRGRPRELTGIPVDPAPFSVILNTDTGVRYSYEPDTFVANLVLDPAVSVYGVALESRLALDNSEEPFSFDYGRASWDLPGRRYRVQAGDLAWRTTELFHVRRILGLSFFRLNNSLNDRRSHRVLLDGIFLPRDGEVEVFVNGRRVRRLVLPAGTYQLAGVGLSTGINVVQVRWTGEEGPREVELIVPAGNQLLDPGELDAGIALGLAERDPERPLAAFYQRVGVGQNLTLGFRQGAEFRQPDTVHQVDLGLQAITATRAGNFSLGTDYGFGPEDRQSISVPVRYTWVDSRAARYRNLDITGRWRRTVNLEGTTVGEEIVAGTALTMILGSRMSLTPRINWGFDLLEERHRLEGRLSFRTAAGGRASVRVDMGFVYQDSLSFVAGVTVSAAFPDQRQNVFFQQNLVTQDFNALWNRYHDETVDPFDFRAGFQVPMDPDRVSVVTGGAGYRTSIIQSSVSHLVAFIPAGGEARNSTSARLQTGLVYADGALVPTRPISDSFIIISSADHVSDQTFLLRQARPGQSTAIRTRPVLLGAARTHEAREISVEMEDFDPSIDTDQLAWIVQPTYRSGTHIRIDPPRLIQAHGVLTDSAGRPVPLVIGSIDDGTTFFTDETGYFEIYDLLPGEYVLRVEGRPGLVYDIRLDSTGDQRRDLGTLQPREGS